MLNCEALTRLVTDHGGNRAGDFLERIRERFGGAFSATRLCQLRDDDDERRVLPVYRVSDDVIGGILCAPVYILEGEHVLAPARLDVGRGRRPSQHAISEVDGEPLVA